MSYQRIDPLPHATAIKGFAHVSPNARAMHALLEGHRARDLFSMLGCLAQFPVELRFCVEFLNRKIEHHSVEVTRSPLALSLPMLDFLSGRLAVQNGRQIASFFQRFDFCP